MNILQISILLFILLETSNVIVLYFKPDFKKANGVGFFKAYKELDKNSKEYDLVNYLIKWVAGTKLIFIFLGLIIVLFGSIELQQLAVIVFIITISTFYFKLYPIIRDIDNKGDLEPIGYSKILGITIMIFMIVFMMSLVIHFML